MLFNLTDILTRPEEYVCAWHDGELYVEPVPVTPAATTECNEQTSKEANLLIAALRRAYVAECGQLGFST